MPQQGMGQMIQMITSLAEMQDRRKKLALDQQQFEQQRDQFAQQIGLQRDSEHWKKAEKLLDLIGAGGADAATAVHELAPLAGFSPQEAEAFAHIAPSAATALQRVQAQSMQQKSAQDAADYAGRTAGLNSMGKPNPTPQEQAQQAAWLAQNTGSPGSIGTMETGNLIGTMAGQANQMVTPGSPSFDAEMSKRLSIGYGIQQATRETPWQFGVGQAGINAGLAPAAASIAAGVTASAGQKLASYDNQMQIAGQMFGHQMTAAHQDITGQVSALNAMHQIAKDLADKKYADKNTMQTMIGQYNTFARLLATQNVNVAPLTSEADAPGALSRLEMWVKGVGGSAAPPPVAGSLQGGGGRSAGGTGVRPPGGY